ncbi:DUF3068 domain-containing protein [Phycicoccus jejuensis]|uniref:DUF3068 domain-containing protein n=1 Tax=Phycicoccus jejuensis TaxID=367299 RepID=UPI0004C31B5A|nr:DUF3068 domain-containing protein [Phycicoccus jejuensis]
MRGIVTKLLVFLGAFLVTTAILSLAYASGQVQKTPLDVDTVTRLSGEAQVAGPDGLETTPVKATSITHADSELSTGEVVLFQNSSCLVRDPDGNAPDCVAADDPSKTLLSASTDTFATDRRTALPVNDFANLPADAAPKEGLINKFPFGVEQKTYPFWDGLVGGAVDATYQGEEDVDGLATYKFLVSVKDAPIQIADGVAGTYSTDKTLWIEPTTGSIIDQKEHQVRLLDDGSTFLDLTFGFTPETVRTNVDSGSSNASQLGLLTRTVPLVGGVLGVVALLGGLALWLTGRRGGRHGAADDGETLERSRVPAGR